MVARDALRVFQAGRFENKFQMLFGGVHKRVEH